MEKRESWYKGFTIKPDNQRTPAMKFSTQTLETIRTINRGILVQGWQTKPPEQKRSNRPYAVGCKKSDRRVSAKCQFARRANYPPRRSLCLPANGQTGIPRAAQVLKVFGKVKYKRSYYHCRACGHRWSPLDEHQVLGPGSATPLMTGLLGLAGVTASF